MTSLHSWLIEAKCSSIMYQDLFPHARDLVLGNNQQDMVHAKL